jgi:ribonuclease P protein component
MLPPSHRLRRSADFTAVLRRGQRAGRTTVVVHLLADAPERAASAPSPPRFGLVVARNVGNSVVRHRVSRRIRALLAQRTDRVAAGTDVVVRARPEAAAATSAQLGADLDSALSTVRRRVERAQSGRSQ